MIPGADITRGRPVFVLAVILTAWVGGRVAMWEPFENILPMALVQSSSLTVEKTTPRASLAKPTTQSDADFISDGLGHGDSVMKPSPWADTPIRSAPVEMPTPRYGGTVFDSSEAVSTSHIVGHAMLFSVGRQNASLRTRLGLSGEELPAARPRPAFVPRAAQRFMGEDPQGRWSGDAWGLWRDGTDASIAAGAPSYGRSQVGAILRYALSTSSPHAPEAFLRASAAVDGAREYDAAAGLSARPIAKVPVRAAIEARITDTANGTQLRAGAYAISEFAPVDLPGGTTGEVYLQAGYVTGDNATAFIDGHARVTREVAELNNFRLSAGGGVWGGAQEGASRLDVGPTASVSFPVGDGYASVSADYRLRVAGDAEPDSGPALTLATGF